MRNVILGTKISKERAIRGRVAVASEITRKTHVERLNKKEEFIRTVGERKRPKRSVYRELRRKWDKKRE